ncbi:EbsA family protein [Bombilactobacillus bombi]|uniref:EbsA family protein n=1 Tax=Bombilactobacillus bombi TaxID=1303590 RepID=UPI0021751D4D|nr:EbsA family protein [Bombilactobacillus bombi]
MHYQLANQLGIIAWCWILSVLLLGGIVLFESQWNNYWGWGLIVLAVIIILLQIQRHTLIIDSHQQSLTIHGLINTNQHHFNFAQIKNVKFQRHQCVFIFQDKSYFPLQLWVSKKGIKQLKKLNLGSEACEN